MPRNAIWFAPGAATQRNRAKRAWLIRASNFHMLVTDASAIVW
jgi:hypothetical protein